MEERYVIFKGSGSGHCCFGYTIMDTTEPEIIGGEHFYSKDDNGVEQPMYKVICECFHSAAAERICTVMNRAGI